jgi:hypothetical protein
MKSHKSAYLVLGVAVLMSCFAGARPVAACSCFCDSLCSGLGDCCSWCPDGRAESAQVQLTPLPGQGARIVVDGIASMGMDAGLSCIAGLQEVSGVRNVNSISVVNALTGELLYAFSPNNRSGESFEGLLTDLGRPAQASWLGFQVTLPNQLVAGVPTNFVFDVTLEKGVNVRKLASFLRQEGTFAGGSANPDGTLDFHHYFVRDLKDLDIQVNHPQRHPTALTPQK